MGNVSGRRMELRPYSRPEGGTTGGPGSALSPILLFSPIREAKKLSEHRTVQNFLSRCSKTSEQWSFISQRRENNANVKCQLNFPF